MNWLQEKLYYRVQTWYNNLKSVKLKHELSFPADQHYRLDLLMLIGHINGTAGSCDWLIDIGANKGELSRVFNQSHPLKKLICIEPNEALNNDIRQNNPGNHVSILNCAISDREGELDFYFHEDSQMSSLSPSDPALLKRDFGEDDPAKVYTRKVPVRMLDDVLSPFHAEMENSRVFLKIDTQGNELKVLKGAAKTMNTVHCCLLEYMFQSPYEISFPFDDIIHQMRAYGFVCKGPIQTAFRATKEPGAVLFLFVKS